MRLLQADDMEVMNAWNHSELALPCCHVPTYMLTAGCQSADASLAG
jgi:hypothetical protein